ncbi:MAG: hypothetical protein FWD55_05580 [Propionibacteriaceae bacterium]|nr:hypothetical protein [Propionibacteriaceae bacterium]
MTRVTSLAFIILIFLTGCTTTTRCPAAPELDQLEGVSMTIEMEVYPADTREINATWHNDTQFELMFGDHFWIEMKVGQQWKVPFDPNMPFHDIGYPLAPGEEMEHQYPVSVFTEPFKPGDYRIAAHFSHIIQPGDYTEYYVYGEFTIV